MRYVCPLIALTMAVVAPTVTHAARKLMAQPKTTVGRNLKVFTSVRLGEPAPDAGLEVYAPYGAPDEAEVLRPKDRHSPRPFTVSLSQGKPVKLAVWSVYLDPVTRRGADMTAQRLPPGISPTIELINSNPAIAKVASQVTLTGAADFVMTDFMPLSVGQTTISINTSPGFTTPANATSVTATVLSHGHR